MARSKKRDPCKVCGTRIFRPNKEAVFVCRNGHVLEGSRIEDNEAEFGTLSVYQKRKKAKKIAKPKKPSSLIPNLNESEKKFSFFMAYQYILRLQVQTLISQLGFPSELESVVKKFWSYYLDSNSSLKINWSEVKALKLPPKLQTSNTNVFESTSFLKAPEFSGLENKEDSDSEEFSDPEQPLEEQIVENHKDSPFFRNHSLRWSLVLIYLGCRYLSCPVLAIDVLNLANKDELPFHGLYYKLPSKYNICPGIRFAFVSTVPSYSTFQTSVWRLGKLFTEKFKVQFPSPSFPFVTLRLLHHFDLPSFMYVILKNIHKHTQSRWKFTYSGNSHFQETPEAYVAALLLIALKCIYKLDEISSKMTEVQEKFPTFAELVKTMQLANQAAYFSQLSSDKQHMLSILKARPLNTIKEIQKITLSLSQIFSIEHMDRIKTTANAASNLTSEVSDLNPPDLPQIPVDYIQTMFKKKSHEYESNGNYFQANEYSPEIRLLITLLSSYFLGGCDSFLENNFWKNEKLFFPYITR